MRVPSHINKKELRRAVQYDRQSEAKKEKDKMLRTKELMVREASWLMLILMAILLPIVWSAKLVSQWDYRSRRRVYRLWLGNRWSKNLILSRIPREKQIIRMIIEMR
jgi:hypothetical protein